jgi:putative endonuclease
MGHQEQGRSAEGTVDALLRRAGWEILARNLRTPRAEVDIVAMSPEGDLVVVEVKSRHPLSWGQGEEALGWKQRARLANALRYLGYQFPHQGMRIDLWCVDPLGLRPPKCYSDIEWKPGL